MIVNRTYHCFQQNRPLSSLELEALKKDHIKKQEHFLLISNVAEGGVKALSDNLLQVKLIAYWGSPGRKTSLLNSLLGTDNSG
jgi:hypothetical protein